jgi:hypothetical protein
MWTAFWCEKAASVSNYICTGRINRATHRLIRSHISRKHQRYPCTFPLCGKSFAELRSRNRHMVTAPEHRTSETSVFSCRCDRFSSARWDKFKDHILGCQHQVSPSSEYTCKCGETFCDHNDFVMHHDRTHQGKRGRPKSQEKQGRKTAGGVC